MRIGDLIRFDSDLFFEGAVQLRWLDTKPNRAKQAASNFVFHGPRYHGIDDTNVGGGARDYPLIDTASFVRDLVLLLSNNHDSLNEKNTLWLAVAGYGSGKSHLALTIAELLQYPESDESKEILQRVKSADLEIGSTLAKELKVIEKPVLVVALDGSSNFHLGNELSRSVIRQLKAIGADLSPIQELSPRFKLAEDFVQRNYKIRSQEFQSALPDLDQESVCIQLQENNESIYDSVDHIYELANGNHIPVEGQESAQDLITTVCNVYCGSEGPFSSLLFLFDEFGRYLEYVAEKPLLAGDFVLQQIYQGIQDNSNRASFVGFIQYELKAYLNRFNSKDLKQLQRYIGRYDTAHKHHLSTNLETLFAHLIHKRDVEKIELSFKRFEVEKKWQKKHPILVKSLTGFSNLPVWGEFEKFNRVIVLGCWPLDPLTTWFLTQQQDIVQSRSALSFIKEALDSVAKEEIETASSCIFTIPVADIVLRSLLPEIIAAEQMRGGSIAESLQTLLEKHASHLSKDDRRVLAAVMVVDKLRTKVRDQEIVNQLLQLATGLESLDLENSLTNLSSELGAVEWNAELGQYELITDAATRGQFQKQLRKQIALIDDKQVLEIFVARGKHYLDVLGDIDTDFSQVHHINTREWQFSATLAHPEIVSQVLKRAIDDWEQAIFPDSPKGQVIYCLQGIEGDSSIVLDIARDQVAKKISTNKIKSMPIWLILLQDFNGEIIEYLRRVYVLDQGFDDREQENYHRFIPDEKNRCLRVLGERVTGALKNRKDIVAGLNNTPSGRLKAVGQSIFESIYKDVIPFPFDGFATQNGAGAADCAQLARALVDKQVSIGWIGTQPRRLANRATNLLAKSWNIFSNEGTIKNTPNHPELAKLLSGIELNLQENPNQNLGEIYDDLLLPPLGFNASSAIIILGLLIGKESPARLLRLDNDSCAVADWLLQVFPSSRYKHFFDKKVLNRTNLIFLDEDAISRWRKYIDSWEEEQNYSSLVKLANDAIKMRELDPLPETLKGSFMYLQDKSNLAAKEIFFIENKIREWDRGIEKAEQRASVHHAIEIGHKVLRTANEMEGSSKWPNNYVLECHKQLEFVREIISYEIGNWIPRQNCQSIAQISEFRERTEKEAKWLDELGFRQESQDLSSQTLSSISKAEELQKFSLTLAQCNDYPHQPKPTDSTPVRTLRDSITLGDDLISGVSGATAALSSSDINAYISAITQRQSVLKAALKKQQESLGIMYSLELNSHEKIQEALVKINRLRDIFVGTRDEDEINEMAIQLERILVDVQAWVTSGVSEERLGEVLVKQIEQQLVIFNEYMETKEIEPAWNAVDIYHSLMKEQLDIVARHSEEWVNPRLVLGEGISSLNLRQCISLKEELIEAPAYLSLDHLNRIMKLQKEVQTRIEELEETERSSIVKNWLKKYREIDDVIQLDRYMIEELLKDLQHPPCDLNAEERDAVNPIKNQLIKRIDQLSLDELFSRIEDLSKEYQMKIMKKLKELLG